MKTYALVGVTSLLMAMAVCAKADYNYTIPIRKTAEIHRESKLVITKTAVNIICSSTDYKQDCASSLGTVRSPDPRNLIRSAFDLAIISIRSGINRGMIDLKGRADKDMHMREALNSCRELMDDAIDDLRKTRDKFGVFLFTRFSDFVEDLLVWLSGSITFQQTCIDGFEGIDSEAAVIMERVMRKGQILTSNGLAIASNLDGLLKSFRIPILTSRRDHRLGIFGSGSSQEQPMDSSEDLPQKGDSSQSSPKNMDSSQNQPLDSSENQQLDSSKDPPQKLNPSENRQSGGVSENQQPNLSENRPLDSPENQPSDSSNNRPLDPLRKLNPLRKLDPLAKMDSLKDRHLSEGGEFPRWVTSHSRRLLAAPAKRINANVVVAKDGSGKCKTIAQALAMVPMRNTRKFVIHIKQGVYKETVEVTKKMANVVFVGDGPTKTIITGDIAFLPNRVGTYRTATVAVNGDYFMAKDIGFENTAGAARHQAVALRVSADFAVFFNCHMNGYQDTLYVHTHRQFYRDCRISGTIDFVFGDAKAVFQNCEFVIRRPMDNQQCIVTAQGRKDRRETTGIVIHNSRITGDATYLPVKAKNRAFLGRPWKEYSRTIIMNTEIDDVIDPEGWLKWNETFALNTLFYSEYRNRGRGSGQARRVRWRGIRRMSDRDAKEFSPGNFLRGNAWIPQTRVPYNAN
ncbi:hypothetical protein EUTSA_v10024582mg [Eutrema salsugineum]|uniref:Pectinesterase n=1 Tax=Eutrema salsugineum TaxID=72664 RepID=V4MRL9_EUTSA|nr:hypothetical protein EUTSA_v10024582mg [Eutrema salsugineum]